MKSISEKKETAEENVIETVLEESSEETMDLSKEAKTEPVSKKKKST